MEYEKKYTEALERAQKELQTCGSTDCDAARQIFRLFPELKESEDDRIRGAIIHFISHTPTVPKGIIGKEIMITWLEKQGEPIDINPSEFDLRLNKLLKQFETLPKEELVSSLGFYLNVVQNDGTYKADEKQSEKKPFDYENQETQNGHKFNIGDIISNGKVEFRVDNIVKNCIGQDCYFLVDVKSEKNGTRYFQLTNSEGKTYNSGETTWLCKQVDAKFEKQGEQKPFDYENATIQQKDFASNEDKPRYSIGDVLCDKSCTTLNKDTQPNFEIIDIRDGMYICDNGSFPISQQDEYELVAKKIEQKPAWSEADEKMLEGIVDTVKDARCQSLLSEIEIYDDYIDWLKSIKQRIGG